MGAELFGAVAADSIQNGPFSGAAAEKDVASEARSAPVPGGPGASKTVCVPLFLKNDQHPGSARRKISKSWIGPKVPKWPLARERNTFSKTVCLRLCDSRRQPTKILFGPSRQSHKLFRTFDKPSCFVKARATITLREQKCAPVAWNSTVLIYIISRFVFVAEDSQPNTFSFLMCESDFEFKRIIF